MKLLSAAGVDYVHTDSSTDLSEVRDCYWGVAAGRNEDLEAEFPLHMRSEYYHRTEDVAHLHKDFLALYFVRSGRGIHRSNGHMHSVARGDVFLMPLGNTHSWRVPVELVVDAVYFRSSLWGAREWEALFQLPELASFLQPGPEAFAARGHTDYFGHLSPGLHAQVEATLASIRYEKDTSILPLYLAARARFYALLVQLAHWRVNETFTTRPARSAAIAEILRFCDANFYRPISTESLAAMMHVSLTSFFSIFKQEVGMPPASYLRHLRLQHAKRLLVETTYPVLDVARLSGFHSATQLGRAFSAAFGLSPLAFRKKHLSTSGVSRPSVDQSPPLQAVEN